jgi:hypothetical protein
MKSGVRLGELYTPDALRRANIIYNSLVDVDRAVLKETLRDEIVKPALRHINTLTGIVHDPDFLAYSLILTFQRLEKRT